MIFGWLENGKTDRWVMVDAIMPWPALHNGRNAMRTWAEAQNAARALEHSPGPRRCPWPCKVPVKEDGSAEPGAQNFRNNWVSRAVVVERKYHEIISRIDSANTLANAKEIYDELEAMV